MAHLVPFATLVAGFALLEAEMHFTMPPVAWLALVLILHGSRSFSSVAVAPLVWLAAFATIAIGERASIPAGGPAYAIVVASLAATFAVLFTIDRVATLAIGAVGLRSTLIFPVVFVAIDFLRSKLAPNATWGAVAYTQYGVQPLMQLAAFAGIWGITFLMAWSAATIELAWRSGFAWTSIRGPVLTNAVVLGAAVLAGTVRIAAATTDRPAIRAATINRPIDLFVPGEITRITEGNVGPEDRARIDRQLSALHDWFLEGSRREARAGARLVAWPEQSLLVFADDEPAFLTRAQRVAADEHVYLAMGLGTIHLGERLPFENKLVLVDPAGRIVGSYLKSHPVPGWEASIMRRGDGRLPVVATADARMALAICYDGSYPEFIRQAALGSADVLILPVNDWKSIRHAHFQMHAFRAIESGVPIVTAAASGVSGAFDAWGRVLAVADYFAPGDRTMTAQLPIGGVRTLYARTGDLFAWLCVAGLAATLVTTILVPLERIIVELPRAAAAIVSMRPDRR